ncbi:MAG: heparinase II/III family protein [Kordiimonadaceae bacterium]|nr:heparinase II/III family protein [Kordiimonadaceae bacterium]
MTAAFDQFAKFTSNAPLTRSTLRRDKSRYYLSSFLNSMGRSIREWGYSTKLYEHRLKGRHPLQLLGGPIDPATGNTTLGSAILGGDMLFENEHCKIDDHFWKNLKKCSPAFREYAHSFSWLHDLAQSEDTKLAAATAERIIAAWLIEGSRWHKELWEAETLAHRLLNWLCHAPLTLSSMDLVYRSGVLLAMAQHTRHLMRAHKDVKQGLPEIYTSAALTLAGLLLPNGDRWLNRGKTALEQATKAFILPDGGPLSRNITDAVQTLRLLTIVRCTYVETDSDLPPWIQITLDRIAPHVRAMRHGNGSFAQISGAFAEGGQGVDAILAASDAKGRATGNSAHVGIQRIEHGSSCLILDAGAPPPYKVSASGFAGVGAFEFSSAQDQIVINVGPANFRGPMPELCNMVRSTAAHSTLVIADTNSSRLLENGKLGAGVGETLTLREGLEDGTRIKLLHDGYENQFGVKHQRTLSLTSDGKTLVGEDKLFGPKIKKLTGHTAVLRFHLHPSVEARMAPDNRITLETGSGKLWIFDTEDGVVEIEDSLYLGHPLKPQATKQIRVQLKSSEPTTGSNIPVCKWTFSEIDSA